ncbi:MAG: hypothetical protein J6Z13_08025, partial [Clostridia bacterium]|nr:hypothetical protein [Clostridia bacterium]
VGTSVRSVWSNAFDGCFALTNVAFAEPEGWYVKRRWFSRPAPLSLSDPAEAAKLMKADRDRRRWFRK